MCFCRFSEFFKGNGSRNLTLKFPGIFFNFYYLFIYLVNCRYSAFVDIPVSSEREICNIVLLGKGVTK